VMDGMSAQIVLGETALMLKMLGVLFLCITFAHWMFIGTPTPELNMLSDRRRSNEPDSVYSKKCVACGAGIPDAINECPKCGWTQPGESK
jgi:hypothetical protein